MPQQREVFVRELDTAEAQLLVTMTRSARDRIRLRRAGIVLASVQGRTAAEAAAIFAATAQHAREVVSTVAAAEGICLPPPGQIRSGRCGGNAPDRSSTRPPRQSAQRAAVMVSWSS